jgi:hypothetical protein
LLEDEDGHSTPIQKGMLPLDLPAAAAVGDGPRHITYDVAFVVRGGAQRLALTVTDTLGGLSSTLSWNIDIAKNGDLTVTERSSSGSEVQPGPRPERKPEHDPDDQKDHPDQ